MADSKTAVNLAALYTELNKLGQNEDFGRAIKVAKKILQENPNEVNAAHCLVISYIREGDFVNALNSITKSIADSLTFEKAYCLYRQNKTEEALVILNKEPNPEAKHKELKAQIFYRMERFSDCLEIYKDLIKNTQDDYEAERETNLSAVVACLSLEGQKTNLPSLSEESYELCYNGSIRLLGEGKHAEAEALLRKAEAMCRKTLEEDGLTEEDIEDELAIIRVQLGYALQLQGRTSEAQQLYQKVLKVKPSDAALVAIAANNSAALNGTQNVFDSRRKLKMTKTALDSTETKLTSKQRQVLAVNQSLFLGLSSQVEQCRKSIELLKKDYPGGLLEIALLQAVLDAKANRLEDGLQTLSQFASSASAEAALTVGLASLQLLLEKKDVERAVTVLEQLLQKNFRLGLLGALVSLHTGRGQRDKAIGFVNQALDKINREKSKSPDAEIKLLKQAAAFHFKGGDAQKAANCLEQLVKLESSHGETNTGNLARLVLLYSQFDPALAQKTSQQLPPLTLDSGPGAVDVDALEAATWALGLKHARKGPVTGGISSPGSGPGSKKTTDKDAVQKKKKKRKIRLPKHHDPNTPPDPERWLPRRERSTYRPKKRDRRHRDARADVGKGTQGTSAAALEAENKFDMSKKAAQKSGGASAAAAGSNSSPTTKPVAAGGPSSGAVKPKAGPAKNSKKKRGGKF